MGFFSKNDKTQKRNAGFGAMEWDTQGEYSESPVVQPDVISNENIISTSTTESPVDENEYYIPRKDKKKGGRIKKMIAIVIPLQPDKSWADEHDGNDYGEMHFIVADNIYLAKQKFYKYLSDMKESKADNVIIDTHGGGAGWIYLDNLDGTSESGKNYYGLDDLKNFNSQNKLTRRNITSLKMITEKVKNDGNVFFLGCTMAKGKDGVKFMKRVHQFNYRTNTYASEAYNFGTLTEGLSDSYYNYRQRYEACIDWEQQVNLDSGGIQSNMEGHGFKLLTAYKGIYQDLALIGGYAGNLLINGANGEFKY